MHAPVIHGSHIVSGSKTFLTRDNVTFGENLLREVKNFKRSGGLTSLRRTRMLPDGGYVTVISMGGVEKILYYLPEDGSGELAQERPETSFRVPMLYSGRVLDGRFKYAEVNGPRLHVSRKTLTRLADHATKPENKSPVFVSERHAIAPNPGFQEFGPAGQGKFDNTQYMLHYPGWYSGAMARVVQTVAGYGKQGEKYADLKVPAEVQREIELEFATHPERFPELQICHWLWEDEKEGGWISPADWLLTPGYAGFPWNDGTIRYNYGWAITDGVGFDNAGRPWLINVSLNGVHAMPLPLVPATQTRAFRAWIESIGDTEILALLDLFGGMPSGEHWPADPMMEKYLKAGIVVRVCDTSDFYEHFDYSPACGWAFAENGREAYNTCYDWDDAEGWQLGFGYKLNVALSRIPPAPWRPDESPFWHDIVRRYMKPLFATMAHDELLQLARYNAVRAGFQAVLFRALETRGGKGPSWVEEATYWMNLEAEPLAQHSGTLKKVSEGKLFPYSAYVRHKPEIKYPHPWPWIRGCRSHDFRPLINGVNKDPRCDTVMYGYYVGNQLKVVKYFRDPRQSEMQEQNDFEECMIVGAWESSRTGGFTEMKGAFYTTDFDERAQLAPYMETTTIKGRDLGMQPASDAMFGFMPPPYMNGTMSRCRFFSTEAETNGVSGTNLQIAVCIPMFERGAALYAVETTNQGTTYKHSLTVNSIDDPTSYGLWTYHRSARWISMLPRDEYLTAEPMPKNADIFWLEGEFRSEGGPCSDFADQGGWRSPIEDVTSEVASGPHSLGDASHGWQPGVKGFSEVEQISAQTFQQLHLSMTESPEYVGNYVDQRYFYPSPNALTGIVMVRQAAQNHMGETFYAVVTEDGDNGEWKHWGESRYVDDHKSMPYFIGVVNE